MDHNDHVNLLRPAGLRAGGMWADFGAGAGAFTLALRELLGPQAEIYAVDKDRARLNELKTAWHARFKDKDQDSPRLHLICADFTGSLTLPALDGLLMANSLHFFKEKEKLLRHVRSFLKPNGAFLLVEYNVDRGNHWVPYPLSFDTWRKLAPQAGFTEPQLLATHPSSFLQGFYSALVYKE